MSATPIAISRFGAVLLLLLSMLGAFGPSSEVCVARADNPDHPAVQLTKQERTWLDQNREKITLFYNPEFPPIEFASDTGEFVGMGADVVAMVEQRLNVTFIKSPCEDWNRHLAALRSGECAIAPTIVPNADRERYAFFTTPYSVAPVVIITTNAQRSNLTLEDLAGLKVGVVSGFATEKYVRDNFGDNIEVVTIKSVSEGLRAVSFGQVDAFVENLAVCSYYIEKEGISNLRVAGSTDYSFAWSIGVSRKYPLLFSSIQKALSAIPEKEMETVRNRWISLQVSSGLSPATIQLIELIAAFTLSLLLCLAAISYYLKKKLNEKVAVLKTAQQELMDQTERLELAMEATNAGIWDYYPATKTVFFSEQWYAMLGHTGGELEIELSKWIELIHPDDREVAERGLNKYIQTGGRGEFESEFRMKHSDGYWRWLLGKGRAIAWDENGLPSRLIGLNLDIQKIKEVQKSLADSEARFRSLFEMAPMPLANVTKEGTVLELNRRFQQVIGYGLDEMPTLDHWWTLAYPEEDYRKWVISSWSQAIEQGYASDLVVQSDEYHVTCGDGSVRTMIIGANIIGNNLLVSLFNITDLKNAEEELRKAKTYISNIIDSMPSVLVGVDAQGNVTQWNKTAEQTTGISTHNAKGKKLIDVFPKMVSQMEKITESIRTRETLQQRMSSRAKNITHHENVTIYPLISNGVEGAVIRIDDVTDQVRMEEMMIQSEKMLSVGGLAAGMAHEINNPLAGMLQTAAVISNRLDKKINMPANQRAAETAGVSIEGIRRFMKARGILRMLGTINDSGRRMASIVNNMLSFARGSEARKLPNNLETLLEKTLELAATEYDLKKQYDFKQIEIKKDYDKNLPQVLCEGAKIQQVLLNLMRNGAQAMQMAKIKNPQFTVRTHLDNELKMAVMEIEDNGPGMDEASRKRIFEPFFTTKPVGEGTGLGLSVSYFIITENHGGEMSVESRPGAGAKFIVRLPL